MRLSYEHTGGITTPPAISELCLGHNIGKSDLRPCLGSRIWDAKFLACSFPGHAMGEERQALVLGFSMCLDGLDSIFWPSQSKDGSPGSPMPFERPSHLLYSLFLLARPLNQAMPCHSVPHNDKLRTRGISKSRWAKKSGPHSITCHRL
jgi:hypothetical protein